MRFENLIETLNKCIYTSHLLCAGGHALRLVPLPHDGLAVAAEVPGGPASGADEDD